MKVTFRIWRQDKPSEKGGFKDYAVNDLTEDMSFLEALDHLNEILVFRLKNDKNPRNLMIFCYVGQS